MFWRQSEYNARRVAPVDRHYSNSRRARNAMRHPHSLQWWNQRYLSPTYTYRGNRHAYNRRRDWWPVNNSMDVSCTPNAHDSSAANDGSLWRPGCVDAYNRPRHHWNDRLDDGAVVNGQPCVAPVAPRWNGRADNAYARHYTRDGTPDERYASHYSRNDVSNEAFARNYTRNGTSDGAYARSYTQNGSSGEAYARNNTRNGTSDEAYARNFAWNGSSDDAYSRPYARHGTSNVAFARNCTRNASSYGAYAHNYSRNGTLCRSRYVSDHAADHNRSYGSRYARRNGVDYGISDGYGQRYNNSLTPDCGTMYRSRYNSNSAWNNSMYASRYDTDHPHDVVRQNREPYLWRPRNSRNRNISRRWRSPLCVQDEVWITSQGWGVVTRISSTPHRVLVQTRESNALFWCNCSRYRMNNCVTVTSCVAVGRMRNGISRAQASLQFREITPEDYDLLCSLDAEVPSSKGMSTTFIKTLAAGVVGETCGVCLDTINEEDDPRVLPCSMAHSFHFSCIEKWLSEKTTCPLDMTNLADEKGE